MTLRFVCSRTARRVYTPAYCGLIVAAHGALASAASTVVSERPRMRGVGRGIDMRDITVGDIKVMDA